MGCRDGVDVVGLVRWQECVLVGTGAGRVGEGEGVNTGTGGYQLLPIKGPLTMLVLVGMCETGYFFQTVAAAIVGSISVS